MKFHLMLLSLILLLYFVCNFKQNNKNKNKFFLKISFIILFIFMSIRGFSIGNDTLTYVDIFKAVDKLKWNSNFNGYYEPGFIFFNVILSYLFHSGRMYLIVISAIFNYSIYKLIKDNSDNYLLSVIMYICLKFFYTSMPMIRQFLAMVIVLNGIKFCKSKKILKFIFIVFIASLIHSTAWIALLLYPAYNMKYSKFKLIFIFTASIITFIFIGPIISKITYILGRNNYYNQYLNSKKIANILNFIVYLLFLIFTLYKKNNNNYKIPDKYIFLLVFACAINFIAINLKDLGRAGIYFELFVICIIPNIISMEKRRFSYKIKNIILIFFLVLYSSVVITFRPEWNSAYRYKTCFEDKINGCWDE